MEKIAFAFVSTNEGHVLIPALESLFESKTERQLEVVVVDNGSTDGAAEAIRQRWPQVTIIPRDRIYGLGSNLNVGIAATTASYVMLCNPDLVFTRDAIEVLAAFLDQHPRAGLAAPKLVGPEGDIRPSARRWYTLTALLALKGPWKNRLTNSKVVRHSTYADWDYAAPLEVDWVPCPATLARRAALDEIGPIDERFRIYFEDVDISLRMHESGWQVWCVPQAEIVHLEQRDSTKPFSRAWRWHLQEMVQFAWKHKGFKPRIRRTR